jgi:hypothetical protein
MNLPKRPTDDCGGEGRTIHHGELSPANEAPTSEQQLANGKVAIMFIR